LKTTFFIIMLAFSSICLAEALTPGGADSPAVHPLKFYILPVEPLSASNDNYLRFAVSRAVYNFMRIIPSLEVPDAGLSPEGDADYVMNIGNSPDKNDKGKTDVGILVWSKAENTNVFMKTYEISPNSGVFGGVYLILQDVIKDVLKTDYVLAELDFDIESGTGRYNIYINNKFDDAVNKGVFKKSISVLAGLSYNINIIRVSDGMTVYNQQKTPLANEKLRVEYVAVGNVIVDPVRYGIRGKKYIYKVDGMPAYENEEFTNMSAASDHILTVEDQSNNIVYSGFIVINDGLTIHAVPEEETIWPVHYDLCLPGLYSGLGSLGVEYYPSKIFWAGAGCGFNTVYNQVFGQYIYEIMPHIEAGYYFYGDIRTDFRAGAGLTASYYQYFPQNDISQVNPGYLNQIDSSYPSGGAVSSSDYSAGIFAVFEWKFLFLRVGASFDFGPETFFPAAVIGLKL